MTRTVFLPSFAAVSLAAWYGGIWAGLLASLLCVLGIDWFVIPPPYSLRLSDPSDYLSFAGFVAVSSLIGGLTERLDVARREALHAVTALEEANLRLQEQAMELELSNQNLQEIAAELEAQTEELQMVTGTLTERSTEAESARRRAEEANAAKSQFLATMSHELRTPLNAIQGHTQLLELELYGPVTALQRDALGRIDRAQRHLLGLINDILSYARLESGKVEYHIEPVSLRDVVQDVVQLVEPQFSDKGVVLDAQVPAVGDGMPRARADREKVRQIVLNLLSNAQKFTPAPGRVAIESGPAGSDGKVMLRVSDSGIGIPADKLEAVFEPFVQVRSGYTSTTGGTGLGLAISRDLARAMGGDLSASSTPGQGSAFTLVLPGADR